MSILDEKMLGFDGDDVKIMIGMLKKFHKFHQGTGLPDYSPDYVAYLPVFAISLLMSQTTIERFSQRLEKLTWALVVLTAIMAVLMVTQLV